MQHSKESFNKSHKGPGVSEQGRSRPRTCPTLFAPFHTHCQPEGTLVRYSEDLIPAVPPDRPSGDELSSPLRVDCSLSSRLLHERPPVIHLRDPILAPSKRDRYMVVSGNHRPGRCATVISMNKLASTSPENILNELNKGLVVRLTVRQSSQAA